MVQNLFPVAASSLQRARVTAQAPQRADIYIGTPNTGLSRSVYQPSPLPNRGRFSLECGLRRSSPRRTANLLQKVSDLQVRYVRMLFLFIVTSRSAYWVLLPIQSSEPSSIKNTDG